MIKVIIDPSNRIKYSSFYIKGLEDVFGKKNVSFSSKYFNDLNRKSESNTFDHYMAFILVKDKCIKKIIIDFRDKVNIKQNAYEWCDRYAKINLNKSLTKDQFITKIISIPPSFGIKCWGFWKTSYYCLINLLRCRLSPLESFKIHFIDYYGMYFRRTYIENYDKNRIRSLRWKTSDPSKTYIFFISTLWQHDNCVTGTNVLRKKFIDLCKMNEKIAFEGGFYSNTSHPQYNEYKDIIFLNRYPISEYVEKTKLSSFVFNTPAVFNCHGWKLGEFLALGKAIISTPISNEMPEELIHGKNIHIVNNSNELEEAINLLLNDEEYRKKLETGTNSYYEEYVSPKKVVKYVLKDLLVI